MASRRARPWKEIPPQRAWEPPPISRAPQAQISQLPPLRRETQRERPRQAPLPRPWVLHREVLQAGPGEPLAGRHVRWAEPPGRWPVEQLWLEFFQPLEQQHATEGVVAVEEVLQRGAPPP
jgi:hypothetical protein